MLQPLHRGYRKLLRPIMLATMVRAWLPLVVVVLFFGTPAFAEGPRRQSNPSPIVVTGHLKDVLRTFVQSLSKEGPTGQIARWDRFICPTVIGIDPAQARFVERQIIDVAQQVGLRPLGSGCTTSFIMVVTTNARGFTKALIHDYSIDFRTDGIASLRTFAETSDPVRWISISNECGGSGCELPNSRITKSTKPVLQSMVVVVDADSLHGYSLGELSDYLALVGLTNPPQGATRNSHSILSMFNQTRAAGTPFQLTQFDKSFLAGLYNSRLDAAGETQRMTIVTHMRRQIDKETPRS